MILLLAMPCTVVRTVETSNSFLSAVTAVFALHVATNMLWNAPPVCLSNLSVSNTVLDSKLHLVISKEKHRIYRSFAQWRTSIFLSFGYDPLYCSECNHKMEFLELYYSHKRVPLEEMYECPFPC